MKSYSPLDDHPALRSPRGTTDTRMKRKAVPPVLLLRRKLFYATLRIGWGIARRKKRSSTKANRIEPSRIRLAAGPKTKIHRGKNYTTQFHRERLHYARIIPCCPSRTESSN
ncbi:unnamed protein product [Xylocopa violacea]|uniref:Uncharacterized protein n=1 Tax=Xylocopa violacea TaxID=135666 RepID=A0ABP1NQD2_XYLVO